MRSKLNLPHGYYQHALLFLIFNVSVWTYFIYKNGPWTSMLVTFPLLKLSGQRKNERVSLGRYSELAKVFKLHDEDHTVPTVLQESIKMACNIPKLNPFEGSIKEYLRDPEPANCDIGHPLIFKTDLNSTIIQVKNPHDYNYFNCCYKEIKRWKRDAQVTDKKMCFKMENVTVVPNHLESITIYCKRLDGSKNVTVPVDMFNFVHLKPEVEKRVQAWQDGKKLHERTANVVVLGMDAVSHMNFHRMMPKTLKYITEQLNAIGMDGYTKVGDSTFPNVVAATTGMSVDELKKACWEQNQKPFDSCPLIWKKYAANGYRTAYSEDAVRMAAFNYMKRGFLKPPTDYYNNAFTYHLEKLLGHYRLPNCKMCYGPRLGFQVSLDFLKAMGIRMGPSRRYFQFVWVSSLFHDFLNQAKLGDEPLLETMKWFKEERQLENTIFILMSDHGIRWGGIRSEIQGKIEERMPLLYFMFPDWFRDQYNSALSNLIQNKERLTTHFDLHETLLDLLHLESIKEKNLNKRYKSLQAPKLPRGISLFLPVPTARTCKDAGIDEHWCVCQIRVTLKDPNVPIIRKAAVKVVHAINKMLAKFPQCVALKLDAVLNAQVFQNENKEISNSWAQITSLDDERLKSQQFTCSVSFRVSPSNGTFEATITRHTAGDLKVSGDISRINLYGLQSRCVTDYNMKKFCYCL